MDESHFAQQLCTWAEPALVVTAAQTYERSPQSAQATVEVPFSRIHPGDARSIGLDELIMRFLRNFEMPQDYLDLLASRFPGESAMGWEWIRGLRFKGQVLFSDFPAGQRGDTLLLIRDQFGLVSLVSGPIGLLVRLTAHMAQIWACTPKTRQDFFEHSAYGELLVFIESTVATALGHGASVKSAAKGKAHKLYGSGSVAVSMIGDPPFADAAAAREAGDNLFSHIPRQSQLKPEQSPPIAESKQYPFDFNRAEVTQGLRDLAAEDGLIEISEAESGKPWRNVARWRNECSPYAIMRSRQSGPRLVIDTYYGRAFDFPLHENYGVYGITEALPDAPGCELANHGFLRLPYRKIPRFDVGSRAEMDRLLKNVRLAGSGSTLLYRGQSGEYRLPRSANAREVLYGDAEAIEPSLLTSSERPPRQHLEPVLPAWCLLVRFYLEAMWSNQKSIAELPIAAHQMIDEDSHRLLHGLDLHLYAISMAQHYGLPSMGLDASDVIDIALFFALHELERVDGENRKLWCRRKRVGEKPGVLYVLTPDERFHLNYEQCRPRTLPEGRPERQQARFLHTGWGYSRNAGATHIALAFYLKPGGDFGRLPSADQLFPPPEGDFFGRFLETALRDWALPSDLRRYVEQLYWVAE